MKGKTRITEKVTRKAWAGEKVVLNQIFALWEQAGESPQALLITTAGTTNMIAKQIVGAQSIVHNATFPVVCIVNNGRSTSLFFSASLFNVQQRTGRWKKRLNFRAKILKRLKERLQALKSDQDRRAGAGWELVNEEGWSLVWAGNGDVVQLACGSSKMRELVPCVYGGAVHSVKPCDYHRQHPSYQLELALTLFDIAKLKSPRIVFLETAHIAGREKSYCSFDRNTFVTDLYYNHKPGRNAGAQQQTMGRVTGVVLDLDEEMRVRRAWANKATFEEDEAYHRRTKQCILVFNMFPGCTFQQINDEVNSENARLRLQPAQLAAWSETCHELKDSALVVSKKDHQAQINKRIKNYKAPRRRIKIAVRLPEIPFTPLNPVDPSSLRDALKGVYDSQEVNPSPSGSDIDDEEWQVTSNRGKRHLSWFCNELSTCKVASSTALVWKLCLNPWFGCLAPTLTDELCVNGLIVAIVANEMSQNGDALGDSEMSLESFADIVHHFCPETDHLDFVDCRKGKRKVSPDNQNSLNLVTRTSGGNVTLSSEWAVVFSDHPTVTNIIPRSEHASTLPKEFLQELAGPDGKLARWAATYWNEVRSQQYHDSQTPKSSGNEVTAYFFRLENDLRAAAQQTPLEWLTSPLTAINESNSAGNRKCWCFLCFMFIADGKVLPVQSEVSRLMKDFNHWWRENVKAGGRAWGLSDVRTYFVTKRVGRMLWRGRAHLVEDAGSLSLAWRAGELEEDV